MYYSALFIKKLSNKFKKIVATTSNSFEKVSSLKMNKQSTSYYHTFSFNMSGNDAEYENGRQEENAASQRPQKRPRVSGPSYYSERKQAEVSLLETYSMQLVTSVFSTSNQDADIAAFSMETERLRNIITREKEFLEAYDLETCNTPLTNNISSNAVLKKFYNIMFLLIGSCSQKPQLHDKKIQESSERSTVAFKSQQSFTLKLMLLIDLMNFLLDYLLVRKQVGLDPFQFRKDEIEENVPVIHRLIRQSSKVIGHCISHRQEVDKSVIISLLSNNLLSIEACVTFHAKFYELWSEQDEILIGDENMASLIDTVATDMFLQRSLVGSNADMERLFVSASEVCHARVQELKELEFRQGQASGQSGQQNAMNYLNLSASHQAWKSLTE